ncbi:hypothetical protein GOV08_02375 [Candidatus Woesearchaeota archaeon]|nr:hypothetical protein [Candidatus Woesearchaeota archaeon]
MMKKKKGQAPSAGGAALLLTIIAAMILLYVLFLPPQDRAKLLEDTNDNSNDDKSNELDGKILLLEDPGRLDLIKDRDIEHKISSFSLLSFTEGKVIKEFDSIHIEKGSFSEASKTLLFDVDNPNNIDNVLLSFSLADASGRLIVELNGNVISEKKIDEGQPTPIDLPKGIISKSNFLKLSVSGPSLLFFLTNKYTLEDIKIVGDVTDDSGLVNSQNFFVTEVEKQNLEKVITKFITSCTDDDEGGLQVSLNNQRIYQGVPECDVPIKLELSPDKLLFGENTIRFSADKGGYIVDQVEIQSKLEKEVYQTYFFEIEEEEFALLEDDGIDINMSVIFVSNKDFEDVEVEINGRKFSIDNKERIWLEVIDPYIREGNNAISLRPLDTSVDIVELKIFIIDNDDNNN